MPLDFLFAFTSHGYGHLTRTLEVLKEFLALYPRVEVAVSTTAPPHLVERALPRAVRLRRVTYEPGTIQKNCFEVDRDATRAAYRDYLRERPERLEREERFLRDEGVRGVVADIPALPVRAARRAGIPAAGISNFTWDWILEPLAEREAIETVRADYAAGDLYLSLPFGPGTSPFPCTEYAPLVGRRARIDRRVLARRLRLEDLGRRVVLVCVGGWGGKEWDPICVSGCDDLTFLIADGLPVSTRAASIHLPAELPPGVTFADLVAAADVVVTKPGYGIASECLLNRTRMVGIERRDFREEAELVKGLRESAPFAQLSIDDFFAGFWERAIEEALASATPWADVPLDGARRVAVRLGRFFALEDPVAIQGSTEVR